MASLWVTTSLEFTIIRHRRTSFFLIGFYTLSLVCLVLILKFGVIPSINPPSKKLRGMFVLASMVAGIIGGGVAIFFWKGAKFFIGAWGGFALGLFIQCFRDGGVIRLIGFRWILYIGGIHLTHLHSSFLAHLQNSMRRHRFHLVYYSKDALPCSPSIHRFCRRHRVYAGCRLLHYRWAQRGWLHVS